jgi:hypothetical protein
MDRIQRAEDAWLEHRSGIEHSVRHRDEVHRSERLAGEDERVWP